MGKYPLPLPTRVPFVQLDTDATYSIFLSTELNT